MRTWAHITLSFLFALILACVGSVPVYAQEATSTSFKTRGSTIDSLGGSATSTSFSAIQSADQTGGGESTSTSFQLNAGFLYFDAFTPRQQNWQWFDDETNETPLDALASENVSPSNIGEGNPIKLRVTLAEVADIGQANSKFKLQFATTSDFSQGVLDVVEIGSCNAGSEWCFADGTDTDNDGISTAVLTDSDSCVASVGDGCGTHNESGVSASAFTHKKSAHVEYEFTLAESGARPNTVYFFRLVDTVSGDVVPLNTGETYPSVSTSGTTLTFTIDGLPAATITGGITTTIDTTSTSVSFGALPIDLSQTGAHRLTVTTNATQGYEIFTYAQQNLIGSTAAEIPPITGTNQSPSSWSGGCSGSATGCYGYHTNESVLAGGSTRFAADDTYARFSTTTLDEIAYSSGAVTGKSTDVVYRIEARSLQEADSYSTSVVYIVVPTF